MTTGFSGTGDFGLKSSSRSIPLFRTAVLAFYLLKTASFHVMFIILLPSGLVGEWGFGSKDLWS